MNNKHMQTMYENAERLAPAFEKMEGRMLIKQGVIRHPVIVSPGQMQAFATEDAQEVPALLTVVTNQN